MFHRELGNEGAVPHHKGIPKHDEALCTFLERRGESGVKIFWHLNFQREELKPKLLAGFLRLFEGVRRVGMQGMPQDCDLGETRDGLL